MLDVCRLVRECEELWADADAWQEHLLRGACALTGTAVGAFSESRLCGDPLVVQTLDEFDVGWRDAAARGVRARMFQEHPNRAAYLPRVTSLALRAVVEAEVTVLREDVRPDDEWYGSPIYKDYHRPAFIDGFVMSFALNPLTGNIVMIQGCQDIDQPAPTFRAKRVLSLLNRRVAPLVGVRLATRRQRGLRGLSPRQRQTLEAMLDGMGEKEIASHLRLHAATVHEYVAAVYRHFNVRCRGELLSYFVRRRPS